MKMQNFKSLQDSYILQNSLQIPCIGFGTWRITNEDAPSAVKNAIEKGYRHIDTASAYNNEEGVGLGVRQSGVAREKLFITSKLNKTDHGYSQAIEAFNKTLERLQTDYLDLYLIHSPRPTQFMDCWEKINSETWQALEDLYSDGKIKAIGISNFEPLHMKPLLQTAKIVPMVNQIKLCPGHIQDYIVTFCKQYNMLLEAYSPLDKGEILGHPLMFALSEKYNKTPAQVCLRWSLQMGFLPLPKTLSSARMAENAGLFDFELSDEDVKSLSQIKEQQ